MSGLPWLRLYTEARNDAKLRCLADDEHRVWFSLLCYAAEQDQRGIIPDLETYVLAAEVAGGDEALLERTLAKLERLQIVCREEGGIGFVHFTERQYDKPSDQPERVAERVRRHRQRVTPRGGDGAKRAETRGNALDTDTDTDTEVEHGAPPHTPQRAKAAAPNPAKPAREQPTQEGYRLLSEWCELTKATVEGDARRREARYADALLARCRGDPEEALAFVRWRLDRGQSPALQYAARDYADGWRHPPPGHGATNGKRGYTAADLAAMVGGSNHQ